MNQRIIVPALLAIAACAAAADGASHPNSLRLSLTGLPTSAELEVTGTGPGGTATVSAEDDWDDSSRLSIGAYFAQDKQVGFYAGIGLAFSGQSYEVPGVKYEQSQVGVFFEPGVVFNANEYFSLEVGIPIGLGISSFDMVETPDKLEADGAYAEIGLVVRPVVHFGRGLVFLEVGTLSNSASYSDATTPDYPGVNYDIDATTTGAFFSLGGGFSF